MLLESRGCRGRRAPDRAAGARTRGLRHDADFVLGDEVGHHDVEHEAIELRFRQRIRAFELDRILRGEHEERRSSS